MGEVKFYVPPAQQERWKQALESTTRTSVNSRDLLSRINDCMAEREKVAYGYLDPYLTEIFARFMKP